ncbi:hypothetical protein HBI56_206620 [Parastagonospora nodorum]|nr:hypothetical protein HBI10_223730 [Parastagonospora nodorum]KAH4009839.1 hypothetical protein HBI13_215710 [Parastagonospora nodorum]KAH4155450.1 hypothetical protein HBH43_212650 [Parastagonospora nodorum]KAH4216777.1 hypothetical protein HBI06_225030 [Parastagonospora nodorum]KAH4228550.1 hypothetical protein HBI05_203100 [Parastagonospora nodorum]
MRLERIDSLWNDLTPHKRLSLNDLCEDVILLICDHLNHTLAENETPLKNLSLTNRRFHDILCPLLFKTLQINRPVSQLMPTSLPARHARTFKLDMFGSLWWWCSGSYTSSSDAMDLFRCLQTFPNLKTLEISMMRRSIDIFSAAFSDPDPGILTLDKIENLVVTSSAAFLVNHCPNLKSLVVQDGSDCLLETYIDLSSRLAPLHASATTSTPPLRHLDATATWSTSELLSLVQTFPHLQHLRMRSDTYCYRASTPTIIDTLGKNLPNLQTLHLVKSGSLGMGYQSVWQRRIKACSNAEYRRMLWRENEKLRVEVENTIVRGAFGRITRLRECWLGEKRVARRCGDGWMWERKSEDVEDCVMGDGAIAKLRMEKEAVVVEREMGW